LSADESGDCWRGVGVLDRLVDYIEFLEEFYKP